MFTKALNFSLFWARLIQFMTTHSHSFSSRCIVIFSCLLLGLPNGLFPSFCPPKSVFPFSSIPATCTTHLILLNLITKMIWWAVKTMNLLCSFLQSLVTVPFEVHIVVKQVWILLIFQVSPAHFICYWLFTVWTREHPVSIYDCRCYRRKDSDLDSASTDIRDLHNAVTCGSAVSGSTDV